MNLYFLVEGRRTEPKIYPSWLQTLLPSYQRVKCASSAESDNYYLISGKGYPRLLDVTLPDAMAEIIEYGNYDFFIIVLDADDVTVAERIDEVLQYVDDLQLVLNTCQIKVVVQNCCLESWLLGNRKVFQRSPQSAKLREFIEHYNVYDNDPELMPAPSKFKASRAEYHVQYLKQMLNERNISYTKKSPGDVAEEYYLRELVSRVEKAPSHLLSFQDFVKFCESIAAKSNQKDPLPSSSES